MNRPEDALETAVQALAKGQSIDTALADFPHLRAELLPLLRAAAAAQQEGGAEIPVDVSRRLRMAFLDRAAELRSAGVAKPRWGMHPFPRLAMTLGLVLALALTSTGLVRASSATVPGDQLYRVKRSWEGLRLLLSVQPQIRYMLASEFEQERLDEIQELLAEGNAASIGFSGVVSLKQNGNWLVSGIPVAITGSTILPATTIVEGEPVLVFGVTQGDGVVVAERVTLLPPRAALPPLAPSMVHDDEQESQTEPPRSDSALSDGPPAYVTYQFTGIVERLGTNVWQINRQRVLVQEAAILGSIKVGSEIWFEGYYARDGTFVATRIESTTNLRHDDGRHEGQGSGGEGSGSREDSESSQDREAEEPEADP
jgi:hypothetical protein